MLDLINFYDDFFDNSVHHKINNICMDKKFKYGELDDSSKSTIPTGVTCNFDMNDELYKIMVPKILSIIHKNLTITRSYINLFSPGEKPNCHRDSENIGDITVLYYPNLDPWNPNDNGETLFYDEIKNITYGIAPVPNRLVIFPANLLHSASSMRNKWRHSIAFKFKIINSFLDI
jgi:hypothetical protein